MHQTTSQWLLVKAFLSYDLDFSVALLGQYISLYDKPIDPETSVVISQASRRTYDYADWILITRKYGVISGMKINYFSLFHNKGKTRARKYVVTRNVLA